MTATTITDESWIDKSWRGEVPARHGVRRYRDQDGYIQPMWTDEQRRSHRVYFVLAGEGSIRSREGGPIKVGFTTDVPQRLKQLQTASPVRLSVVDRVVGNHAIEALVHGWLQEYRLRGEWYRLTYDRIADVRWRLAEEGLVTL